MFIGRERELQSLERLYRKGDFQLPVIYGRRRVGKTAIIERFTRDLPTVYFTAVEADATVNLRNLSRELYAFEHPDANPDAAPLYSDFYAAFEAAFVLARRQRVVFVIDEFPYLAKAEPGVPSYLQALVDRNKDSSQMFLILCGKCGSGKNRSIRGFCQAYFSNMPDFITEENCKDFGIDEVAVKEFHKNKK